MLGLHCVYKHTHTHTISVYYLACPTQSPVLRFRAKIHFFAFFLLFIFPHHFLSVASQLNRRNDLTQYREPRRLRGVCLVLEVAVISLDSCRRIE